MFLKNLVETSRPKSGLPGLWHWMLVDPICQTIKHIRLCIAIKRERESLIRLTDSELQDLGIHRGDADAESRRSFFDIPADRMNLYSDRADVKNQSKGGSGTVDF